MENEDQIKINSYLTFKIGSEEFGAHVSKVLNIVELPNITRVPKTPDYMKGVINLRGMVLPVIDTRVKFGMAPTEFNDDTCIVVMDLVVEDEVIHVGALVDSVVAVREFDEKQIQKPPGLGVNYRSEFITGVVQLDDTFILILDLIRLFTEGELLELKKIKK